MNHAKYLIDIKENPFVLFNKWFEEANQKEINDANAMNLATVGRDFRPSSRMVLLKSYNNNGFIFYTNLKSYKAINIKENNNVALNFHWKSIFKQIRIEGITKLVSNKEADDYFESRSEESKISAWASNQSSELINREELERNVKSFKNKFDQKKIPRPPHWSGFIVEPNLIEFWHDKPFRLHDRVKFIKSENKWIGKRLNP